MRVLPDANSPALAACDKNSSTRVLAAAVYLKLEHHFFDDTLSHMDIASAFRCNVSQLSKALTGVNYASGPHHYKPKEKKTPTKRTSDTDTYQEQAKKTSCGPRGQTLHTQPLPSSEPGHKQLKLLRRIHCPAPALAPA